MNENFLDLYRKIGLNVAYYRKSANMTQEKLAELVGVDSRTISRIENASQRTTLDFIYKASQVLDVPLYRFLEFKA